MRNSLGSSWHDNYQYDALYRLTGVVYREGAAKDYRSTSSGWTTGEYGQFNYDDNSNRTTSTDGDPFGNVAATADSYSINEANEYTQITRDSAATNPAYDAAGNTAESEKHAAHASQPGAADSRPPGIRRRCWTKCRLDSRVR